MCVCNRAKAFSDRFAVDFYRHLFVYSFFISHRCFTSQMLCHFEFSFSHKILKSSISCVFSVLWMTSHFPTMVDRVAATPLQRRQRANASAAW